VKILLDNCVDWRVARLLPSHDTAHAKDVGWENLSNGRLLAASSEAHFEVLITVDKRIKHEQNLDRLPLTVVEIDTFDSRLPSISAISSQLNQALTLVHQFRFISVNGDGQITTLCERK
jgi:hypothetical protein